MLREVSGLTPSEAMDYAGFFIKNGLVYVNSVNVVFFFLVLICTYIYVCVYIYTLFESKFVIIVKKIIF